MSSHFLIILVQFFAVVEVFTSGKVHAETIDIVAAGASFPERLYDALSFAFASELPQYTLSYKSLGSGKGKCRIMSYESSCAADDFDEPKQVDWAGTDSTHKEADYETYEDLQMYPAVAGAVVAVYNLDGVHDLILPQDVLAAIFRRCSSGLECPPGWIDYWNDSRIVEANPHVPLPTLTAAGEIKVVVRADSSGTTEIFRQSLASFSPEFIQQMGPTNLKDGTIWTNCSHLRGNTNRGVSSLVLKTKGSIGYLSLDEATSSGLKFAGIGSSILNPDGILRATSRSVEFALLERGFSYGNNGEPAKRLTASVMGATGSEAWPMVGYTYFSVRLNTKRTTNCNLRRAVLHWFEWFYASPTVVDIASNQGFIVLPEDGRHFILDKIRSSFKCDGVLLYDNAGNYPVAESSKERMVNVNVHVSPEIQSVVMLYRDAYRFGGTGFARIAVKAPNTSSPAQVQSTEILVLDYDTFANEKQLFLEGKQLLLPFAGIPWGLTYSFCDVTSSVTCPMLTLDLVLSPHVAVDILSGRIEYWNDTAIKELQETPEQADLLPFLPIQVISYPSTVRERRIFEQLCRDRLLNLDLQNISPIFMANNFEEASRMVTANPGSVTFGPINRNTDQTLSRVARIVGQNGIISDGSSGSVKACIQDSMSSVLDKFHLTSNNPQCWPWTNSYLVSMTSSYSTEDCLSRSAQEAAYFAQFLLKPVNESIQDPLSLVGMASLDVDSTLELSSLACFGRSITSAEIDMQLIPIGLIWVVRAVGFVLIIGIITLALWIYRNRLEPVLRASSPIFMWQMCLGFLLEMSAIYPLTMQESPGVYEHNLNVACMAAPWLYFVGLTLVYGSLLAKTWRIYKIFHNPAMRRIHITAAYLTRLEFILFLPIFVVLLLWTLLDPFVWKRSVANVDPTTGAIVSTKGECTSNNLVLFIVPIMCIFAAYILTGLLLAWKNRNTPTEFSEGRYVSGAILTDTELLIIGVPVLIITSANPIAAFVVKVTFIILSVSATILVFFYPKFAILNGFWDSESGGSSSMLGRRLDKNNSRPRAVKDGSSDVDNYNYGGNNPTARWSYQPQSSPASSSTRKKSSVQQQSSSNVEKAKGLIPYRKGSWFGGNSAGMVITEFHSDHNQNVGGGRGDGVHVGTGGNSKQSAASLTTLNSSPNESGDGLENDADNSGGTAAMFFGNRVLNTGGL